MLDDPREPPAVVLETVEAEVSRVAFVVAEHRRAADQLELVEFDCVDREFGKHAGGFDLHALCFARESEDHVRADAQAESGGLVDGIGGLLVAVPAVHAFEAGVVATLDADLQDHDVRLGQLLEVGQFPGIQTVRARADDDPDDARHLQRLAVERFEPVQGRMGVGEGLEVGEVSARVVVALAVEADAGLDLLADGFVGIAVARVESPVIAKSAAPVGDRAVAVRASEARVDRDLLHPFAEGSFEILRVGVEPAWMSPWIRHAGRIRLPVGMSNAFAAFSLLSRGLHGMIRPPYHADASA